MGQIDPPLPTIDPTKDVWGAKLLQAVKAIVDESNDQDVQIKALKVLVASAGTPLISESTPGLREAVQDILAATVFTGPGLTWAYDDPAGRVMLTLDSSSSGSGTGTGTGTGSGSGTGGSGTGGSSSPIVVTKNYTESTAIFANPGRGFFQYSETHYTAGGGGYQPLTAAGLQVARNNNRSVVFRYFTMEKYVDGSTLEAAWLNLVAADLQACRDAGVKIMPRFCYSTADRSRTVGQISDAPNDYTKILAHQVAIAQVVNQYKDVIHGVQAGMIGTWGEWYYTDSYGTEGTVTDDQWGKRLAILNQWLTSLDASIPIYVRYVGIKTKRFGNTVQTSGPALRVGFHNDGFLAPYGDYGTFSTYTSLSDADARAYLAADTQNVGMNGETAAYNGNDSAGPAAKTAMAKYHWDLLNPEYNGQVLGQWSTDEMAEITRRLGYRLSLTATSVPTLVPGGTGQVSFTLTNTGWAPMRQDKTMYVTLQTSPTGFTRFPVTGSAASIQPGYSATFTTTITAPTTEGTYNLHLELVDPLLPTRGEYAVRLANVETTYTGTRNLFTTMTVSTTTGGSSGTSTTPATSSRLLTEAGALLTTQAGDYITL